MLEDDLGLVSAPESPRTSARYWTHTRQVKATPLPLPAVTLDQLAAMRGELRAQLARRPTFAPSTAPPSSTVRRTAVVEDTAADPFAAVLKMFMTFGGGMSVGSAFVVGKRAVLTAGHCVYADGTWARNVQFIPRYTNGVKPHGTFNAVKTTTLREFTQLPAGPRFVYDIAACVVDKDFPDELRPAAYSVNALLPAGPLRSLGYPAEPDRGFPFDGERLWASDGDYHHEDDAGFGTTAPRVYAHYCDLTGGCSGGPIVGDGGRVVGLNSHVLLRPGGGREDPPRMFSPYFGDAVMRLLKWLEDNGGFPNKPGPIDHPPVTSLKADLQQKVSELSALIGRLPG